MRRILIVDDEPAVVGFLRRVLDGDGWLTFVARSGAEALTYLASWELDVILIDIELGPGVSGLDVLRQRPELNRDKRYIILTGKGTLGRCREAFLYGAADFLEKPVHLSMLLAALHSTSAKEPEHALSPGQSFGLGSSSFPPLTSGARHMRAALREMELRYAERDLTVQTIAQAVGVSPEYLCRLFGRELGCTPLQKLHSMRVENAKLLLTQSNLPIKAIAAECGYHTTAELDQHFARLCSCSPSVFRTNMSL
jgi:YesN/AraC family two-component response regulator